MKTSDILIDIRTKNPLDSRREKAGMNFELRFFMSEDTDVKSARYQSFNQLCAILEQSGCKRETTEVNALGKSIKNDDKSVFKLMGNSNLIIIALKLAVNSGFINHDTVAGKLKADPDLKQLQTEYYTTKAAPPSIQLSASPAAASSSFAEKHSGKSSPQRKDSLAEILSTDRQEKNTTIRTR